jgi:hypothetical protein
VRKDFPKPGNPDVLVFAIQSRPLISERVLPFMRQYMTFSSRRADLDLFETALALYDEGFHRTPYGVATIVEIGYAMNMNGKQRKRSLDEILDRILRGHTPDVPDRGEDMVRPPRRRGELGGTETTQPPDTVKLSERGSARPVALSRRNKSA